MATIFSDFHFDKEVIELFFVVVIVGGIVVFVGTIIVTVFIIIMENVIITVIIIIFDTIIIFVLRRELSLSGLNQRDYAG